MPRRAGPLLVAWALGLLVPALLRAQDEPPLLTRERRLEVMGSDLQLEVLGPDVAALDSALDAAVAEMRRIEDLCTDWRASPLTTLNEAAGQGPQPVDPELLRLIARSLEVSRLTGGAFDVTFASVGKLWDFKRRPPLIPDQATIDAALAHVGWQKVAIDPERGTIALPAGTRIGLGGIAQGYGADRAMAVIMRHGIRHALVNVSGDVKALGRKQGQPWRIAVKHPRDRERVLAVLPISNTCLITSGDYERFFFHEGKRYHHILDPRTGYPATGAMSATVLGPEATVVDALATALCVLPPAEGLALIERLPRTEALIVGLDGEVHLTSGLRSGVHGGEGR